MDDQAPTPASNSPSKRFALILGAVTILFFSSLFLIYGLLTAGQGDSPLVTDRTKWPTPLVETLAGSALTERDLASIELTPHLDGWFLRMKATPSAQEFVRSTWAPLEESQGIKPAEAIQQFWDHLPHRWRNHKPSPSDRYYATRQWNMGEEGLFHYVARLNDEESVILIWIYYNF